MVTIISLEDIMSKKLLIFLLALACVTFFTACGNGDTTSSSSTSSEASTEASSEAASSEAVGSEDASSAASENSDTAGEASVYRADGFSFEIPEGFQVVAEADNSVTFVNADFKILGVEIQPNTEGITTITQEDLENDLVEGFTDTSLSVDYKLLSFKNLQVDGREAAIIYCSMASDGAELPITAAEIINGDNLITVVLMSGEDDTAFVEKFLSSMKFD